MSDAPALHRLAFSVLSTTRSALMFRTPTTIARASKALLRWAKAGAPMLAGETKGSAPERVIRELESRLAVEMRAPGCDAGDVAVEG